MSVTSRAPVPFHESPPATGRAPRRRMLLLAFYFPPGQAAGALRWQKLARHAAARGWALDVITQEPGQLEASDATRLAELPAGTRVFGAPDGPLRMEIVERALRALRDRVRERLRGRAGGGVGDERERAATTPARVRPARPATLPQRDVRWALGTSRGLVRMYGAWFS